MALNPQKLAGQCGKLKCCLNYELAGYEDARKNFPDTSINLRTKKGEAYHLKTDVYRGILLYANAEGGGQALVPVPAERVSEILRQNRNGRVPEELIELSIPDRSVKLEYTNGAGEDSLTRFERERSRKKKKKQRSHRNQRKKQ